MRVYTLRCQMMVPVSIDTAFAVFENPYNLLRITPPWLGLTVTNTRRVVMRLGEEIDYTFRWMRLQLRWKTLITEYNPPHSFVDEQARGPYALWRHTHRFQSVPEGTLVSDAVDYALPLGGLGILAHTLLVKRQLVRIFEFRQRALSQVFDCDLQVMESPRVATAT